MAYTVNKTDTSATPNSYTVQDSVVNDQTDISLIGKGYAGYGEQIAENFLHILENFADQTQPTKPIIGQLWYDKSEDRLKVYTTSNVFSPLGGATYATDAPSGQVAGDFWINSSTGQLYFYNGSSNVLVGPPSSSGTTNGLTFEVIADSTDTDQNVTNVYNDGTRIAIISEDSFTPKSSITGFASITAGINLSTDVSGNKLTGTATNADALGGVAAANYLRSNANDTTSGSLGILSDSGLTVGAGSDLTVTVSGTDVTVANTTSNGDIIFTVNDGGVTKTVMTIDGGDGLLNIFEGGDVRIKGNLTVDGTQTIINTTTLSVEDNIIEVNRNVSTAAAMPNYSGLKVNRGFTSVDTEQDLYWVWDETFADDGSSIYGNAGGAWTAFKSAGQDELSAPTLVDIRANIVHATSTSAQYADLAERYATDVPVSVGDVVILGGTQEITLCTKELDDAVFGVVSENPAYLMNADAGNNDSHPMIALKGRVSVKIAGTGQAGDRIVSAGNGEARVANLEECTAFNTLGRLIQAKYSEQTELHECVIGVK